MRLEPRPDPASCEPDRERTIDPGGRVSRLESPKAHHLRATLTRSRVSTGHGRRGRVGTRHPPARALPCAPAGHPKAVRAAGASRARDASDDRRAPARVRRPHRPAGAAASVATRCGGHAHGMDHGGLPVAQWARTPPWLPRGAVAWHVNRDRCPLEIPHRASDLGTRRALGRPGRSALHPAGGGSRP